LTSIVFSVVAHQVLKPFLGIAKKIEELPKKESA